MKNKTTSTALRLAALFVMLISMGWSFKTSACNLHAHFTYVIGSNGHVTFTNTSTGLDSSATYCWNPGDSSAKAHTKNYSHTYTHNGTYDVTLTVKTDSCTSTVSRLITINNICDLHANFTYVIGTDGHVTFTNTSTGVDSTATFTWVPGDSSANGHNRNFSHTYLHDGVYLVTLTVHNGYPDSACSGSVTKRITISNVCNLHANFTITYDSNGLVVFTNTTTGADSNATYNWNPGDGSSHGHNKNFSHRYTHDTVYYVTLTVQDPAPDSCRGTITKKVTITNVSHHSMIRHENSGNSATNPGSQLPFILSPNPSKGQVRLSLPNLSAEEQTAQIEVMNIYGAEIYKTTMSTGNMLNNMVQLNVPDGMYIMKITTEKAIYVQRFVINK
jgi:PKD repeat protein